MHMALVIGGGIVLLGLFVLFGWLWGASAAGMALGAKVFVPAWLRWRRPTCGSASPTRATACARNSPILLIVFALPAVAAAIAVWRLSRG